jgi:hypothetical protein
VEYTASETLDNPESAKLKINANALQPSQMSSSKSYMDKSQIKNQFKIVAQKVKEMQNIEMLKKRQRIKEKYLARAAAAEALDAVKQKIKSQDGLQSSNEPPYASIISKKSNENSTKQMTPLKN